MRSVCVRWKLPGCCEGAQWTIVSSLSSGIELVKVLVWPVTPVVVHMVLREPLVGLVERIEGLKAQAARSDQRTALDTPTGPFSASRKNPSTRWL